MNILITGASRGIGAELAMQLADGKHKLILVARSKKELSEVADNCNRKAGKQVAVPICLDLNDLLSDNQDFREKLSSVTGVLDVLVNNAGMVIRKPLKDIGVKEMQEIFNTNFFAPVQLIQTCLPALQKSKEASVINVTSMAGVAGSRKFPGLSIYSASKGALTILTESLAEEFKDIDIRVNGLAFGAVQTEMLSTAFPGYEAQTSAREMGRFFAWFVTEGWRRFNGKVLPVSDSTS